MPDVDFRIIGAEAATNGLAPLLQFKIAVRNCSTDTIHSVVLHAQIQIQSRQRPYNAAEKEKLVELFGTPDRWGQTLRNRLWTTSNTTLGAFNGEAEATLSVPCTYDLSISATKYFCGLEEGDIPLLFLFSGTVFYASGNGSLQAQPISWNKESQFRLPISDWRNAMEQHFPNSKWLSLRHDLFDRLTAYKRANGDATWEQTIERLVPDLATQPPTGADRAHQHEVPAETAEVVV